AGLAAGFSFRHFAVGPVTVTQEAVGLRLRFGAQRMFSGGQVMMSPESTGRLRGPFLQFIAGGPAATVLLFTLALWLPGGLFTNCLVIVNLMIAGNCLIPFTINGRSTDAKLIVGLARSGPSAERLATILYLLVLDSRGMAPRDWPAESVSA